MMAFMVRITTQTSDDELVFKVEGCLAGPAVRAFETCWRDEIRGLDRRRVRVDLTAVCHVDGGGRELLSVIHRAGALFVTKGCVMPEVIREISGAVDVLARLRS